MSSSDVHGSVPAIAATLCIAAILAPFAYAQFGTAGFITIACFAATIIASVCLAAWGAARLSHSNQMLAALFASSGIRMVAPLMIALIVVISHGRIAPPEMVIYVVPLYLSMLGADIVVWIRDSRKHQPAAGRNQSRGSKTNGKVG